MTGSYIIKAKYLWEGNSGEVKTNGAICVEDGIIKSAGTFEEVRNTGHEQTYDLGDATLLPGFIDCHTHLSMDATMENYLDHMTDPVPELTLRAVVMMKKDLESGTTTCRCCGDKGFLDIACRTAVERNMIPGPRLLVATRGIRASSGHGFVGYPFDGAGQVSKAVKENIEAGADFIKIYISGTLKGEDQFPSYLAREEIRTAIDEAHNNGLRVAAHCVGGVGLDWALELGLDSLEHVYHISDAQVSKLAKSKTMVVLTPGSVISDTRINKLPANLVPGHFKERDEMCSRMSAVIASGIPFALGTDGLHGDMAAEILHAVRLGAPVLTALRSATITGAEVCGIADTTGSIMTGKSADIIAVKGNPFENINVIKEIKAVIVRGKFMVEEGRWKG